MPKYAKFVVGIGLIDTVLDKCRQDRPLHVTKKTSMNGTARRALDSASAKYFKCHTSMHFPGQTMLDYVRLVYQAVTLQSTDLVN